MKGGAEVRGEKATTGAGEGVIKKGNKRELGKMYCLPRTHTYTYIHGHYGRGSHVLAL